MHRKNVIIYRHDSIDDDYDDNDYHNPSRIEASPEPGPNFQEVMGEWGLYWPLHYYTFGILFFILLIYVVVNLTRLLVSNKKNFQRFRIFLITNCMLLYFAFMTSFSLLINPYESEPHIKIRYEGLLFLFRNLTVPCLTASFCLVELSILEAGKLQLYSKRLQSLRLIFSIISIHFIITFALSIKAIFTDDSDAYLLACRICYIILGILISISSIHTGRKIILKVCKNRMNIDNHQNENCNNVDLSDLENGHANEIRTPPNSPTPRKILWKELASQSMKDRHLRLLTKTLLATAVVGFLYWATSIFALISKYAHAFDDPNEWEWLIIQSIFRTNELVMGIALAYITNGCKKGRTRKTKTLKSMFISALKPRLQ